VAAIVTDRLKGAIPLFPVDSELLKYADPVVKKIQTEGKWQSARKTVVEFDKSEEPMTAHVFVDNVEHGFHRELGPALIGHAFWECLGFPKIFSACNFSESEIKTAEISILNRLISQDSESGILSWLQTVAIDELLDIESKQFGRDRFYRISDKILKHQSLIEKQLYQQEKDLFGLEDCLFLYDLTNTYFEGVCSKNAKAKYCKNQKEKRSDCPQVVVALVLDGDGFVRHHRVFNGKMSDSKSLKQILKALETDFAGKPMPTIVFDRGMVTKDNLALLQKYKNLKYIVMCKSNEEAQFIEAFQTEKFEDIKGRKPNERVEILIKEFEDIVYLLCKSEGRKEKEHAMRNTREVKLELELKNFRNQITKGRERDQTKIEQRIGKIRERFNSVAQYYDIQYIPMEFSYSVLKNETIRKRLSTSLLKLKEKVTKNSLTFPTLENKLQLMQKKYPSEFDKLSIVVKAPYERI